MGVTLPGGQIISGIGGCVFKLPPGSTSMGSAQRLDVAAWALQEIYLDAECTHSGTWGCVARRRVAYDWMAQISVPMDQSSGSTIPGILLRDNESIGLRLNLGDVTMDGAAAAMGMTQKYYHGPSGILSQVRTILDATGKDVIRQDAMVKGNGPAVHVP